MSRIELHRFAELKGAKEDINIGIELVTREKASFTFSSIGISCRMHASSWFNALFLVNNIVQTEFRESRY